MIHGSESFVLLVWMQLDQFLVDILHKMLILDGLSTSRPLFIPVSSPAEIESNFDVITYSKVNYNISEYRDKKVFLLDRMSEVFCIATLIIY